MDSSFHFLLLICCDIVHVATDTAFSCFHILFMFVCVATDTAFPFFFLVAVISLVLVVLFLAWGYVRSFLLSCLMPACSADFG